MKNVLYLLACVATPIARKALQFCHLVFGLSVLGLAYGFAYCFIREVAFHALPNIR
jgi:hypothetical protein